MEDNSKRTRRSFSREEKIAKFQEEISKHEMKIAELKNKIAELEKPAIGLRDVTARIKELGISPDEVMKALDKLASK